MRYFAIFFTVVFLAFAVFQYNDPDPVIWFALYGYAAAVSVLVAGGRYQVFPIIVGAVIYLVGAIYYFPPSVSEWIGAEEQAASLQMKVPFVEEAREAMGLFICFAVMVVYLVAALRMRRQR